MTATDASPQPDLARDFDTLADHALSLILDDHRCEVETCRMANDTLGRPRRVDDPDGDTAWWEAKTDAVNVLLDRARALNNVGRDGTTRTH